MKKWPFSLLIVALPLYAVEKSAAPTVPQQKVADTLDGFHKAASEAQFDRYMGYFAKDAVFIGTDARERWTVDEFRSYVKPHFAKGEGWTYISRSRHISLNTQQDLAWFDEILDSEHYGTSRGSGILIKTGDDWKIAQYHLTFPIPNDLAKKFTSEIKAYEKNAVKR